jgi:transposase, IS5 family
LGRPKKDEKGNKIKSYNAFQQQQANQRNHVEGQFGTAKDSYALNKVKAKTTLTSESWIANIFFILNINRLLKIVQKAMPDILGSFLKTLKSAFFPLLGG